MQALILSGFAVEVALPTRLRSELPQHQQKLLVIVIDGALPRQLDHS